MNPHGTFSPVKSEYRKGRVTDSHEPKPCTLPGLQGPLHHLQAFHVDGERVYVVTKDGLWTGKALGWLLALLLLSAVTSGKVCDP